MKVDLPSRRPKVYEQDIDAVLERQLNNDPAFSQTFVAKATERSKVSVAYWRIGIDRQVPHEGTTGSIDILIRLFSERSGETGRILIENKLDSGFTPNQPERYASSAAAMSRAGRPAVPIICAPAEYLGRSKYLGPFSAQIAYEEIATWLAGEDRTLIEAAILRFLMPYEPDPVPEVRIFHEGYEQLVRQLAPELVVKPNPNTSGERPEASRTIYFVVRKSLPAYDFLPTLRFSHQCWDSSVASPSVKIMFDGWAPYETPLRRVSAAALGNTGLYLRKAGRSLGLVHDTPRMDNKQPVGAQMGAVTAGIRAAAILRAWMCAHETTLREWASVIARSAR